jgi:ubiquinone biosynthesis protein UbiJ
MTKPVFSPFDAFKPLAGRVLEAALNRLLALDPEVAAQLARLDGRRVELQLAAPPLALAISVQGGQLRVGPSDSETPADLSIGATLGGLLRQLPPFRDSDAAPAGKLTLSGDAELAQRVQRLLREFSPDFEAPFVQTFGEIAGHQIAKALHQAMLRAQSGAGKLARDSAEFLTEESRDLVAKAELEAFFDEVDHERDRAERLSAKLQRLHTRLPEGSA